MNNDDIKARIASFPQWHYQFELNGQLTPAVRGAQSVNRHAQRNRHLFQPLVELCGGDLRGKRVLDLGCNAGFWSLQAIEQGCDFVLGIDGRQMHIDQAQFVFEAKGVDPQRYRFQQANIFDLDFAQLGQFDIVLCLGLLYHVSKPLELFERIAAVNTDLLVIDTAICGDADAILRIAHEPTDEPRHAVDYELVFWPSRKAVQDMTKLFGYQTVVLRPEFTDWSGLEDFAKGARRVFFSSRKTDLTGAGLDVE